MKNTKTEPNYKKNGFSTRFGLSRVTDRAPRQQIVSLYAIYTFGLATGLLPLVANFPLNIQIVLLLLYA